jgi:CheY-like chemotaxis protein
MATRDRVKQRPMTPRGIVFLVDDDDDMRSTLDGLLSSAGWLVVTAADGNEALGLMRHCVHPAVAVIDLMMPGMSGWELISRMTKDPKLSDVPIVVLSGKVLREPIPGVTRVLEKPIELPGLLGVLDGLELPEPSGSHSISSDGLEV